MAKIQEECSDQLEKLIEDNRKLKNKVISLQTFAQRNKYKMKQMKRKGNLHIPYDQKIHTIALMRVFPESIVLTTKPRIDAYVLLHQSETWC